MNVRFILILVLSITLITPTVSVFALPIHNISYQDKTEIIDRNFIKPVKIEKECHLSPPKASLRLRSLEGRTITPEVLYTILHCVAVAYNAFGLILYRLDLYVEWTYDGSRIYWIDYWASASAHFGWVVYSYGASVSSSSPLRWRITAHGIYYFALNPRLRGYLVTHAIIYATGGGGCT